MRGARTFIRSPERRDRIVRIAKQHWRKLHRRTVDAGMGWQKRTGLEDARNPVHHLRLTVDNRIAIGGSDVTRRYSRYMLMKCFWS